MSTTHEPTTFERLCTLLVTEHRLARDRLRPETALESLGIDSLGTVELLWNVETAFSIKLPLNPPALVTLADVVLWIDELVLARAESGHRHAA